MVVVNLVKLIKYFKVDSKNVQIAKIQYFLAIFN